MVILSPRRQRYLACCSVPNLIGLLLSSWPPPPHIVPDLPLYRSLTRLAEVGEIKQFYKPKHEKEVFGTVPYHLLSFFFTLLYSFFLFFLSPIFLTLQRHDFTLGTDPARLPWASEPHFQLVNTGTELWNWPTPEEKFEDNPEQLGRIMTTQELADLEAREAKFKTQDM